MLSIPLLDTWKQDEEQANAVSNFEDMISFFFFNTPLTILPRRESSSIQFGRLVVSVHIALCLGGRTGTEDGDLDLHEVWAPEVPRTAIAGESLPGWRQWGKIVRCNHVGFLKNCNNNHEKG